MAESVESIGSYGPGHSKNINRSIAMNGSLNKTSGAGAAVAVTLPADPARGNIIGQITVGYDAAPTGGSVKIEDEAGTLVWGPFPVGVNSTQFTFAPAWRGRTNKATVITLAAGGGAVLGTISVSAWVET